MFGVLKKIFVFAGRKRGTLKHAMLISFLGAVFASLQFGALMLTLDALLSGGMANITLIFGVLLLSTAGRTVCFYCSTNAETNAGYHMVAEKRVHIGDRLRYIPMGYFNENSLGNITAMVTTTLGDVENTAARCLVMVIGGFLNTLALCLALLIADWRFGLLAICGILCYLGVTELSQRAMRQTAPARQQAQMDLVAAVLEYIQGMAVVKSYGLERDTSQTAGRTIDESCRKALALEKSAAPWFGLRQFVVHLFSAGIVLAALAFYSDGTLPLARCLLMLVVSFTVPRRKNWSASGKRWMKFWRCWRSAPPPSGSGFCSTPCMISAMRRLPRCAVALRFPFARALWAFAKSFSNSSEKHTND